jgi:hypothetical protein
MLVQPYEHSETCEHHRGNPNQRKHASLPTARLPSFQATPDNELKTLHGEIDLLIRVYDLRSQVAARSTTECLKLWKSAETRRNADNLHALAAFLTSASVLASVGPSPMLKGQWRIRIAP